jgi:hypothetical protein
LFIAIFVQAYKTLGVSRKILERQRSPAFLPWVLGAALTANAAAYFGITYFDQTILVWYALLAAIAAQTTVLPQAQLLPRGVPVAAPREVTLPSLLATR